MPARRVGSLAAKAQKRRVQNVRRSRLGPVVAGLAVVAAGGFVVHLFGEGGEQPGLPFGLAGQGSVATGMFPPEQGVQNVEMQAGDAARACAQLTRGSAAGRVPRSQISGQPRPRARIP